MQECSVNAIQDCVINESSTKETRGRNAVFTRAAHTARLLPGRTAALRWRLAKYQAFGVE